MTLQIGSKKTHQISVQQSQAGYTFIEVMVALGILSFGIVMIFKVFLVSLDHMSHLTNRIYATTILDHYISLTELDLRAYKVLPFQLDNTENMSVGKNRIMFEHNIKISPVESFLDIFQLDIELSWMEGEHQRRLSRSSYISDFTEFSR